MLLVLALCLQSATVAAMVCADVYPAEEVTMELVLTDSDHDMMDCHKAMSEPATESLSHSESECCEDVCLCLAAGCSTLALATLASAAEFQEGNGTLLEYIPAALQGIQQVHFRPPIIR